MRVAGIDIGSLTTKIVIMENNHLLYHNVLTVAEKTELAARRVVEKFSEDTGLGIDDIDYIVSTGIGRGGVPFAHKGRNSVLCLAKGAHWLLPSTRTIIEVGAENSMAISVDEKGGIKSFVSNDKCAAGAGVFLEAMTKLTHLSLEEMADEALRAEKATSITSTCTIFTEQEVISYAFDSPSPPLRDIIAGLHEALAGRVRGLALKVQIQPEVVLCGGVAKNKAFLKSLEKKMELKLYVPSEPQITAALGAALIAGESFRAEGKR